MVANGTVIGAQEYEWYTIETIQLSSEQGADWRAAAIAETFCNLRHVLEIACAARASGRQIVAEQHIVAIATLPEMHTIVVKQRSITRQGRLLCWWCLYPVSVSGKFDAGLVNFWLSHRLQGTNGMNFCEDF